MTAKLSGKMGVRLLASVALVGGVSSIAASMPADAAIIPDPVINITVTPTNPQLSAAVRTDVQWCVPDSTATGDSFEIALPPELIRLPRGFDLRDPSGLLVATVSIVGQPATATFTFTDYVDTHVNVCGNAFFESRLSTTLVAGTTYVLTYTVNHVTAFTPTITPQPNTTPVGRTSARKNGFFDDPADECRTAATDCVGWAIESQLGPFQSITVDDTASPGLAFDCAKLSVFLWSVDANGALAVAFTPAPGTVTVSCSTTSLHIVGTNIPTARLLRVLVRATPEQLDPAGGVLFSNSATVTHVSENGTVHTDNPSSQRRSALVGGDANGVLPPPAATTTTSEVPTAISPPTTLPAETSTTVAAVLPPVPPTFPPPPAQLPATGANGTLFGAGVFTFLTGALLMLVATRRRRTV